MARPSNLSSTAYSTGASSSARPSSRRTRASKASAPACAGIGLGADAQHRHLVPYRCKPLEHLADHALGRRVGGTKRWVLGFDALELLVEAVVLSVRKLRRVVHVVPPRMVVQQFAQVGSPLRGR
jgi:hypothetical protein